MLISSAFAQTAPAAASGGGDLMSSLGSMLPLILKKLGADPAASSAPFVAPLVDVTGLIIYFTVAFVIMRGTLL